MNIQAVTLEGRHVRLEPLSLALWRWIPQQVRTPDDMRAYIEAALRA